MSESECLPLSVLDQPRYVCALGAMQTVQAIHRAVPVLHAGPGCAMKLAGGLAGNSGTSGYLSPAIFPCSNLGENETIFGGDDQLRTTIVNAVRVVDGDLFVVLSGCTAEIVGDDITAVVNALPDLGRPIVAVETAGFKGTNLEGHEWVLEGIVDQYLAHRPAVPVEPGLVTIWGPVPTYDPFWIGDLRVLADLVRDLGLTPNVVFSEHHGIEALHRVAASQFNLLVSPWVGHAVVDRLEETFGTPSLRLPAVPIGAVQTTAFLRRVGEFAGVDPALVQDVVDRHEREYYYHLERAADVFLENRQMSRRFTAVGSASAVVAAGRFLVEDFGLVPETLYVTDATPEQWQEPVRRHLQDLEGGISAPVVFSTDTYTIHREIEEVYPVGQPLIVGTIYEKRLAERLGANYLQVSTPLKERLVLSASYAGYRGGLTLLEDLYRWVLTKFN